MVTHFRIVFAIYLYSVLTFCQPSQADAEPSPQDARLEIIVDENATTPFVGEMILVTIRGYYDVRIALENLEIPPMAAFDWVQLERDVWSKEMIAGKQIVVLTRRLALFPRSSGRLILEPFTHHLTLIAEDGQRIATDIASAPVTLTVRMPPPHAADSWWLPARSLTYSDVWNKNPAALKDGESVTRTVTISALGANPHMLPPAPNMRQRWLITFSNPERRTVELTEMGPISKVVWVWKLRPVTGEIGTLPEIRIPWFDTSTRIPKDIVLEAAAIGYEGFGDNSGDHWASDFQKIYLLPLSILLGLGATLALVLPGLTLRTAGDLVGVIRNILPNRQLRAVNRAVARNDPLATYRAARQILQDRNLSQSSNMKTAMAEVERYLFSADPRSEVPDLRSIKTALRSVLTDRIT